MAYNPNKIFTVQMRQDILMRAFFALDNDCDRLAKDKQYHKHDLKIVANDERLIKETEEAKENFNKALDDGKSYKIFVGFTGAEVDQILDAIGNTPELNGIFHKITAEVKKTIC